MEDEGGRICKNLIEKNELKSKQDQEVDRKREKEKFNYYDRILHFNGI